MEKKCKYEGWPQCVGPEKCPEKCPDFELETIKYEAFSIIYTVDLFDKKDWFSRYCPKNFRVWNKTEDNIEEWDVDLKSRHRKYTALLTTKEFKEFLARDLVFASSTRTMGSLGAPGLGYGCSPAMAFDSEENDIMLFAYVTPIPAVSETPLFPEISDRLGPDAWDIVEADIWERCGVS